MACLRDPSNPSCVLVHLEEASARSEATTCGPVNVEIGANILYRSKGTKRRVQSTPDMESELVPNATTAMKRNGKATKAEERYGLENARRIA